MQRDFVLDITAQGAWNGGTRVDNSVYENRGMQFKGGIPVTRETIEERIGVRTRMTAPEGVRIGVTAFNDLLSTFGHRPRPHPGADRGHQPRRGQVRPGAVQPHPARPRALRLPAGPRLRPLRRLPGVQRFGGDALPPLASRASSAPGTSRSSSGRKTLTGGRCSSRSTPPTSSSATTRWRPPSRRATAPGAAAPGRVLAEARVDIDRDGDLPAAIAEALLPWALDGRWDGLIVDNQIGRIEFRIPATAARVQHALMERLRPQEAAAGAFQNFRSAYEIYERPGRASPSTS